MAFRDDRDAARARIEALESEVRALREKNERLAATEPTASPPRSRYRGSTALMVAGIVLAFAAFGIDLASPRPPWDVVPMITMQLALLSLLVGGALRTLVRPRRGEALVLTRGRETRIVWPGELALRLPLVQPVARLVLAPIEVVAEVEDRSTVTRATVRVARDEPGSAEALDRFVDREPHEVAAVARRTIEEAIARWSPELEDADPDRALEAHVGAALGRVGLTLGRLEVVEAGSLFDVEVLDAATRDGEERSKRRESDTTRS